MLYTRASIKAKKFFSFFDSNGFSRFRPQTLYEKKSSAILLYVVSTLLDSAVARDTVHSHAK